MWAMTQRSSTRGLLLSILLLALAFLGGCFGSADPPGSLKVSWQIGLSGGCGTIEKIDVELAGTTIKRTDLPCTPSSLIITDVIAGAYTVKVTGLVKGTPTFEGSAAADVRPSTQTEVNVELRIRPASMQLEWRFEDGRMCRALGVEQVRLVGSSSTTGAQLVDQTMACDLGIIELSSVTPDTYDIEGRGLAAGKVTHSGCISALAVAPGEAKAATLVLKEGATSGCKKP
jgi:hypothetical protein